MSNQLLLTAKSRDTKTKGDLNKLRKGGNIPAVLYGGDKTSVSVLLNKGEFVKAIHREGASSKSLFSLQIDEHKTKENVIIKGVQFNPINDDIIHLDFQRVSMKEKLEMDIEIRVLGTSPGVKNGGVLEMVHHTLKIKCLPKDIPQHIDIDVSALEMGDSVHLKDIKLPEGVETFEDGEAILVHVASPTKEIEVPTGTEKSAEPELISKGKAGEEQSETK